MRMTREERRQKREDQASRRFFLELETISSLSDARRFADRGPLQPDPGGRHYSHLGEFLFWIMADHHVPEHLSGEEVNAFRALLRRVAAKGELPPGDVARFEEKLRPGQRPF
jgi:hypothetical protein